MVRWLWVGKGTDGALEDLAGKRFKFIRVVPSPKIASYLYSQLHLPTHTRTHAHTPLTSKTKKDKDKDIVVSASTYGKIRP